MSTGQMFRQLLMSLLKRLQSRKFLVWLTSSVALFTYYIGAHEWLIITATYLGAQGLVDYRHGDVSKPEASSTPS